ncbi:hypothetical protein BC828DRAFT_380962 [Blastocladiella britannica]|nr:hypothetical protein BC828DRAFT_380962 [Blastocladiella britannica]
MEYIPLILDRILLLASHRAYSLAAGLELLRVLPRIDAPDTHRHVVRRLVNMNDLGYGGHLELVQLLDRPLSENDISDIASGAAMAGHAHILDWLFKDHGPKLSSQALQNIEYLAVTHDRIYVLDWHTAHDVDLCSNLDAMFWSATCYCRLLSLGWLKAYATKRVLDYAFNPAGYVIVGPQPLVSGMCSLDWWCNDCDPGLCRRGTRGRRRSNY